MRDPILELLSSSDLPLGSGCCADGDLVAYLDCKCQDGRCDRAAGVADARIATVPQSTPAAPASGATPR
ncbi:hypothetical protein [Ruegeria arenilitoris]|uniref:hypothetical protein n=1 Tax=Ruegeria arenilitoris TaxID=1173585 RepID=UPI00147B792A|nr:hypothetical protein [Ruegeria arenilitoris]